MDVVGFIVLGVLFGFPIGYVLLYFILTIRGYFLAIQDMKRVDTLRKNGYTFDFIDYHGNID